MVWGGAAGCFPVMIAWSAVTGTIGWPAAGAVRDRLLLDAAAYLGAGDAVTKRTTKPPGCRCCLPSRRPSARFWIGQIQWMLNHGFHYRNDPILQPLDSIATRDALLDFSDPTAPREANWPEAEFIVGNPPFLGGKLLRRGLGDEYVDALFAVYDGRVPREADFVTYWHEKARAAIATGRTRRAGLLATQGIRGEPNRQVLQRVMDTGGIFYARSDEPWVLAGAAVHTSFVGQDNGSDLDGSWTASVSQSSTPT